MEWSPYSQKTNYCMDKGAIFHSRCYNRNGRFNILCLSNKPKLVLCSVKVFVQFSNLCNYSFAPEQTYILASMAHNYVPYVYILSRRGYLLPVFYVVTSIFLFVFVQQGCI